MIIEFKVIEPDGKELASNIRVTTKPTVSALKRLAKSTGSTHGRFLSKNQPQNMKATMKPQLLVRLSQQKIIPDVLTVKQLPS